MGLGGGLFQFKTFGNMHHPSRLAYLGRIFGEQNYSNCGQFYGKYSNFAIYLGQFYRIKSEILG